MKTKKLTYGERIRAERMRLGLSQAQICAAAGISKPTQISYEGGGPIPIDYMDRVEDLGLDRAFIATGLSTRDFAAANLDWNLLGQVLSAIQAWETTQSRKIPDDKRGTLARLLYLQFADAAAIDITYLDNLLNLAA